MIAWALGDLRHNCVAARGDKECDKRIFLWRLVFSYCVVFHILNGLCFYRTPKCYPEEVSWYCLISTIIPPIPNTYHLISAFLVFHSGKSFSPGIYGSTSHYESDFEYKSDDFYIINFRYMYSMHAFKNRTLR
jgi:hypothetical protein